MSKIVTFIDQGGIETDVFYASILYERFVLLIDKHGVIIQIALCKI
jgi:hypothetical protein